MHFHLPKPLHGWREFAGEVGIIVVGVLIALGAEQVVEEVHDRVLLDQVEDRMTAELRDDDLPQAFARAAIHKCNVAELDQIQAAVLAGDRAKVSALADDYDPPFRSWDAEAWKAALASQVLTRGGADKMIGWSTVYLGMPILTQWTTAEQSDLPRLRSAMSGTGPLSAAQQDRLLEVLADLRFNNQWMTNGSLALLRYASMIGLRVPASTRATILADSRRAYGPCVSDPAKLPPARPHQSGSV